MDVDGRKRYTVKAPSGELLQGVKDLFAWEAEFWTEQGYTLTEWED